MEEQTIAIRRLEKGDVDIFRSIRLEALRLCRAFFASTFDDWDALPLSAWQQRLEEPIFVAVHNMEPVGLIGLLQEKGSRSAHRASVVMVYIRQDFRRLGVAKKLLCMIEKFARDNGVTQLELTVSTENIVAIKLYNEAGFVEVGRIPGSFIHDGREIDEIMMIHRLL